MTLFCGSTPADVNPLLSDLNKLIRNRLTLLYSDPRACILQNLQKYILNPPVWIFSGIAHYLSVL